MYQEEIKITLLKSYANQLSNMDVDYILDVSAENPALKVAVPCTEEGRASFVISLGDDYGDGIVGLEASYASAMLPEGYNNRWCVSVTDDPLVICEELIMGFIYQCFYREHEKYLDIEIVNDENLEEFLPMLRDEDLTNDDIYVIGFRINELDAKDTAGIMSFHFTENGAKVDYIYVLPEYRKLGIATFMLNYLREKFATDFAA